VGCRTVPDVVELLAALFSETAVLADATEEDFCRETARLVHG
jgi:hypothetical protein